MNRFDHLRQNKWLLLILVFYLVLTITYSVANPLFESPDEHLHYFTAQTISETGQLPTASDPVDGWIGQEAAQPPLYYLMSAVLISPIDTSKAREQVWLNPYARLGDAASPANTNAFVHSEVEAWPWQGYVLAAHLLRLFSAVIGLGTLVFIYGSARLFWPDNRERALLATALVAFLPQFNFLNSSISNDPLVIFFCAAAMFQLLGLWYSSLNSRRLMLLGLTIGLSMLSKMAGLLLLFYALGFLGVLSWKEHKQIRSLLTVFGKRLALVAGPALLIGGWLLVRNWQLYGDITATSVFIRVAGSDRGYTLGQVLRETPGLWRSFFAVFGWMNVAPPAWFYILWNALVLTAVFGAVLAVIRVLRQNKGPVLPPAGQLLDRLLSPPVLLALWVLVVYAGLIQFLLKTPAAQGRLMFPALVPLSMGLAYGLSRWRLGRLTWAALALLLATSIYSAVIVIPGAFEKPPVIEPAAVPAEAARLEWNLGQGVRLVAAEVETETAGVGDWVWLTLYWQNIGVGDEPPAYVLELFGRDTELLGKQQSYHGGGLFPANLWPPGKVVVDHTAVRVAVAPETPVQGRLNMKLDGETNFLDVGFIKLVPETWPEPVGPPLAEAGGLALTALKVGERAVSPGDTIEISLQWQVLNSPGQDLTTFIHLGEQNRPPLAQGDSPPLNGQYPTRLWAAGEVINDTYRLTIPADLPDGRYPLYLGLYDPASGERPSLSEDGVVQPNNAYQAGWIEVGR